VIFWHLYIHRDAVA